MTGLGIITANQEPKRLAFVTPAVWQKIKANQECMEKGMTDLDRIRLFDEWAKNYDDSVISADDYPFDGYERVLDRIAEIVKPNVKMKVLDLGTGTGNLAKRFIEHRVNVWGVDYSSEMLAEAKKKFPRMKVICADLLGDWMEELGERFDCIVSAYVLHEFDVAAKMDLLQRLAENLLMDRGCFVIGDIAFPTQKALEQVQQSAADRWDEEEYYWVADETLGFCDRIGFQAKYEQLSSCGGVFVIRRRGD